MKILAIVGVTGTGKSSLALYLAKTFWGEIVNFDSRQIYKDFPIITAQPSPEEKERCPHHLYGFLDSTEKMNAGRFSELAHRRIKDIHNRGRLPILVGGTGLYLKAILEGLAPIPPIEPFIRKRVMEEYLKEGGENMWMQLKEVDPNYASKIHPRDKQRITRAMEVYYATGKPFSWFHRNLAPQKRPYICLKLGIHIERDELRTKLKQRIEKMVNMGGVEEVKRAWQKDRYKGNFIWSAIGCRELIDYIEGDMSLDKAKEMWLKNTIAYAKRQRTWFKKDKNIHWIGGKEPIEEAKKKVENFLEENF